MYSSDKNSKAQNKQHLAINRNRAQTGIAPVQLFIVSFLLLFIFTTLISEFVSGQGVGINNSSPNASSILDVTSTNKGVLMPRMTSAQRIAISSPATGLVVYETTTNQFYYFDGTAWRPLSSSSTGWNVTGNSGTIAGTNFLGTTDNVDMVLKTNNTEKMRVTSAGNVGIGNVTPANKLHVVKMALSGQTPDVNAIAAFENNSTGYLNILTPYTSENGIVFGIGGGPAPGANCGAIIFNSSSTRRGFQFKTDGNSTKMVLDSNGNVGIGITNTFARLDVYVPTANDTIIYRGRNLSAMGTITQIGSIEKFQDYSSTIDFNGGSGFAINLNNNASYDLQLGINSAAKPGGGSWINSSDSRLKDDIQTFKDGLETLAEINPVYYRYNGKGGTPEGEYYVGVVAQELQKAAPYMVGTFEYTPDPRDLKNREQYLCVDNSALTYILVNAAKELDEKTEKIAKAIKSITDFGTAQIISGNEVTVSFDTDFSASIQNGMLPVVTVTPVNSNAQISVKDISPSGFTIVANGNAQNLSINWIAAAKISKEELTVSKNYTDVERKQLLKKVNMKDFKIRTSAEEAEMAKRIQSGEFK